MTEVPETQYASLDGDRIAYQVFGEDPVDLVLGPTAGDCIDLRWEVPGYADRLGQLASFARVIMFDRRGSPPR